MVGNTSFPQTITYLIRYDEERPYQHDFTEKIARVQYSRRWLVGYKEYLFVW